MGAIDRGAGTQCVLIASRNVIVKLLRTARPPAQIGHNRARDNPADAPPPPWHFQMRQSFAVPYAHESVFLPSRVRHVLQIARRTVLHGRLIDDNDVPSLIISTIPTPFWRSTFRVVVNTHYAVGSLQSILNILRDADLNILHMWSSATSAKGDLAVTAMVSANLLDDGQAATRAEDLESELMAAVNRKARQLQTPLLSRSRLYHGRSAPLRPIHVKPLRVLRSLAQVRLDRAGPLEALAGKKIDGCFVTELNDGRLNLSVRPFRGLTRPAFRLHKLLTNAVNEGAYTALITPDTEEWHLRLTLMPPKRFFTVHLPFSVQAATEAGLLGTTHDVVAALIDNTRMNLYHAQSKLTSKSLDQSGQHIEQSELIVTGYPEDQNEASGKSLHDAIVDDVIPSVQRSPATPVSSELRSIVFDVARVTVAPTLAPFAFFASNVKAGTKEYLLPALRLCQLLKDLHFRPVFVDRIGGKAGKDARDEMEEILDASPVLVSLHVPETELRTPQHSKTFAPSAWTTYEEAYMRSKKDRVIIRMIHDSVFEPPFLDPGLSVGFSSTQQLERAFLDIRARLEKARQSADWHKLMTKCLASLMGQDLLQRELLNRDPEVYLREEMAKAGQPFPDGEGLA